MKAALVNFFLETVGRRWCVFLCSMLPILELRGAIPLGVGLGLPWWQNYILAVLGNMLPVPIILLFVENFIAWASRSKVAFFNKIANKLLAKVEKKRDKIEKFSFWGVCFFVALPLPVTGAWTGSMVAAVIGMKFWKAMLSALLGVMIAGVIMMLGSYGVVSVFKIFA